jgi:hypothetical protein
MAWFRNHYHCERCGEDWDDEWSCMCDDDCPHCGARHWSPVDSDDLTFVVKAQGKLFVVLASPKSAEHEPDYGAIAATTLRAEALAIIAKRTVTYWN